jgi:hypothetical protein
MGENCHRKLIKYHLVEELRRLVPYIYIYIGVVFLGKVWDFIRLAIPSPLT